jgi:hypothetical protein
MNSSSAPVSAPEGPAPSPARRTSLRGSPMTRDEILDNITLYLLTNTEGSSTRWREEV